MTSVDTMSADERAAATRVNLEAWELFWRFFWTASLIAATVGVATLAAHWV